MAELHRVQSLASSRAARPVALLLLSALAASACKRTPPDPLANRARPAMTAREIADAALPESTASGPEVERARVTMTALRAVVGFWRLEQGGRTRCPTLRDLAAAPSSGFDRSTMATDPWGSPYEIDCLGGTVRLRSLGPDKQPETPDDLLRY
jgi:hypothetical protein